jgi:mannosyltransferase
VKNEDAGRANRRLAHPEVVAVVVPAAVMLAIGLWGLDRGGMWGDEGVTFLVGRRTVPQIWQLLHGIDAVHGLYYFFMHVVLAVHPGEVVLRLPSVCGAAATAALVGALGARLARPRVGLWAGLLYAITPVAGHYAQEGRSYAIVSAGAAGATLLLVPVLEGRARPGWWWRYGALVAVTGLLHELVVLTLCAHAATLALARASRAVWLDWARAAGLVGAVVLPLVWVSRRQSEQVSWLVRPGWDNVEALVRDFATGPVGPVFWVSVGLMVVGLTARRTAAVALPLLVLPPAILISVSQYRPLFHERYVLYALAGAPLLAAAGLDRVAGCLMRLRPRAYRLPYGSLVTLTGVLAAVVAFVQCLPLYRQDRSPAHRPENLAAVAAVAARDIRPGDPVLYLPSTWRLAALTYPDGFRRARDVALAESAARSGTLSGRETTPRRLRRELAGLGRIWVVADSRILNSRRQPASPLDRLKLAVVKEQFTARQQFVSGRVTIRLYVRGAAIAAASPPGAHRTVTAVRPTPPRQPRPAPR